MGWERIVLVNNNKWGNIEDLPFDLRVNRVLSYNSNNKGYKKALISNLANAKKVIIDDFDQIILRNEIQSAKIHDKRIVLSIMEICSEVILMDSLSNPVNSLFSNSYYYDKWDQLEDFYALATNHFIDGSVHERYTCFLRQLSAFETICHTYLHEERNNGFENSFDPDRTQELTIEEKEDKLQNRRFFAHKDPFETETWPQADIRIRKLQEDLMLQREKVIIEYRSWIHELKLKSLL